MNITGLALRELKHNYPSALLCLLCVAAAVAAAVNLRLVTSAHKRDLHKAQDAMEQRVAAQMTDMKNRYVNITKDYGYNAVILPEGQQAADFFDAGFARKTMPASAYEELLAAGIPDILGAAPALEWKIRWTEYDSRPALVHGRPPSAAPGGSPPTAPPPDKIQNGRAALGHSLCSGTGLRPGDSFTLLGSSFTAASCDGPRGSKSDITIWTTLDDAQRVLDKAGRINAIHIAADVDAVLSPESFTGAIEAALPGVEVIIKEKHAAALSETLERAGTEARETIAREIQTRKEVAAQATRFYSLLAVFTTFGAVLLIATVYILNENGRKKEIGLLRAAGLSGADVLKLFLARAAMIGAAGGAAGAAAGVVSALMICADQSLGSPASADFTFAAAAVLYGVALSGAAGAAPAFMACRIDPSVVLSGE